MQTACDGYIPSGMTRSVHGHHLVTRHRQRPGHPEHRLATRRPGEGAPDPAQDAGHVPADQALDDGHHQVPGVGAGRCRGQAVQGLGLGPGQGHLVQPVGHRRDGQGRRARHLDHHGGAEPGQGPVHRFGRRDRGHRHGHRQHDHRTRPVERQQLHRRQRHTGHHRHRRRPGLAVQHRVQDQRLQRRRERHRAARCLGRTPAGALQGHR